MRPRARAAAPLPCDADVRQFHGKEVEVREVDGPAPGSAYRIPLLDTHPCDTSHLQDSSDIAAMNNMHEAPLLALLQRRYAADAIYTFTGDILISINPYKHLPGRCALQCARALRAVALRALGDMVQACGWHAHGSYNCSRPAVVRCVRVRVPGRCHCDQPGARGAACASEPSRTLRTRRRVAARLHALASVFFCTVAPLVWTSRRKGMHGCTQAASAA
ncbi:hypothetical protein EON67_07945 [archaeon]|nr:MAG: hypothetical protein EON67_07945 [archaeon]